MNEFNKYSPTIEVASHALKNGRLLGREFIEAWKPIPKTLILVHPHVTITAFDQGVSDQKLFGFSNVPKVRPEILQLVQTIKESGVVVVTMEARYSKFNHPPIALFPDLEYASQLFVDDRNNHCEYITDLTDFLNQRTDLRGELTTERLERYIRYPHKTKPVEVVFASYPHQRVAILDEEDYLAEINIPQEVVQGKVKKIGLKYIPIEPGLEAKIYVNGDPTRYRLLRVPPNSDPQTLQKQEALSRELQIQIPAVVEKTQMLANEEITAVTQNLTNFFAD